MCFIFAGEYLGLTGARLDGAEMIACGLATHFVLSKVWHLYSPLIKPLFMSSLILNISGLKKLKKLFPVFLHIFIGSTSIGKRIGSITCIGHRCNFSMYQQFCTKTMHVETRLLYHI